MRDVSDIIKNIENIYSTNSALSILKDFERVLDELDLYVFKNWEDGELASGPHEERHWVTASFMWEKKDMPDPDGAKRLLDYGCKIKYEKTYLIEPKIVSDPDDFRPGTKKGKLIHKPIWIVTIEMPKKLIADILNGYFAKEKTQRGMNKNDTQPPEM